MGELFIQRNSDSADHNINWLSANYHELFLNNIKAFMKSKNRIDEYGVFYPLIAKKDADFLVYGQAVNGWNMITNKNTSIGYDFVLNAIIFSNKCFIDKKVKHSPLDWVNVYWSKSTYEAFVITKKRRDFYNPVNYECNRSFFWNVVYKLINKYYGFDENSWDWSKKLVWSNLYKIAPAEGLNPNADEIAIQQPLSIELVKRELEEIKPKYCIVLTNYSGWEPFAAALKTKKIEAPKDGIIESVEQYKNTKIIITTRPFAGSSNMHVEKLIEHILVSNY